MTELEHAWSPTDRAADIFIGQGLVHEKGHAPLIVGETRERHPALPPEHALEVQGEPAQQQSTFGGGVYFPGRATTQLGIAMLRVVEGLIAGKLFADVGQIPKMLGSKE